jgi:hypothetical protein
MYALADQSLGIIMREGISFDRETDFSNKAVLREKI